jgi:hypothetical protein
VSPGYRVKLCGFSHGLGFDSTSATGFTFTDPPGSGRSPTPEHDTDEALPSSRMTALIQASPPERRRERVRQIKCRWNARERHRDGDIGEEEACGASQAAGAL